MEKENRKQSTTVQVAQNGNDFINDTHTIAVTLNEEIGGIERRTVIETGKLISENAPGYGS